jgi:hypothetical protein
MPYKFCHVISQQPNYEFRHARESGNPVHIPAMATSAWMPAFAGMAMERLPTDDKIPCCNYESQY